MSNIDRVNINNPSLDPSYAVQGKDQVRVGQNGQNSSAGNDAVALSSTARELDRFSGLVGQSRESRIDQVRQMLEAGTYHVSGEDIARKLIESNWK
jgi:flagellar biosynthesis anti-sigma factor FlgM